MHESTQISYGEGIVNVVFNSESATEIAAPAIRAGDYQELVTACFTKKELEQISEGSPAEVSFSFVMSDEAPSEESEEIISAAVQKAEKELGQLNEGVYFDVSSEKTIGTEDEIPLESFRSEFEIQIGIPLFLRNDDWEYFIMANDNGGCKIFEDSDIAADSVVIKADRVGTYLMLYRQGDLEKYEKEHKGFSINYLFLAGIITLLILWKLVDKLHNRGR